MTLAKHHPNPQQGATLSAVLPGQAHPAFSTRKYTIGVLPGEGIGPEVIGVCLDVLERITEITGVLFDIRLGGKIGLPAKAETGQVLPPAIIDFCGGVFDDGGAVLCGPGGARFVYELRTHFDLFYKLTPLRPMPELRDCGVVREEARSQVDIVMVRENTGGLYFGEAKRTVDAKGRTTISHCYSYRDDQVERTLRVAISLAVLRRRLLCLVVKPGGIPEISSLWMDTLDRLIAGENLQVNIMEVDNAAFQLINAARGFDVVVSPNMFGDVLADCGSLLLGSRGMSYSGNFGSTGRAVYQTGHGAAYDLAGLNRANPLGQVQSVAMMLRESFGLGVIADTIESAMAVTLAEGWRTADIAGPGSRVIGTREMGQRVLGALEQTLVMPVPA
ncbi:MAG: isocitrate/isopropylmalate family dehydrogenase [Thiobacillus sp.]